MNTFIPSAIEKTKQNKTRISSSRFDNISMTQCHSQNHIVLWIHHSLDSDPSLDFSICSTLILDWGMLKRKPQAQNGIACAKGHDSKPRLDMWLNSSFDLPQNCNLNQPVWDQFLVSTDEVMCPVGPLRLPLPPQEETIHVIQINTGPQKMSWPKIFLFFC